MVGVVLSLLRAGDGSGSGLASTGEAGLGAFAAAWLTHAVYPTGAVCISILHPPGDDPNHYEQASERWSPIQSVEKILISVMSMLAEPNDESPANVEAAKMWRERRGEYEKRVREGVRRSLGL